MNISNLSLDEKIQKFCRLRWEIIGKVRRLIEHKWEPVTSQYNHIYLDDEYTLKWNTIEDADKVEVEYHFDDCFDGDFRKETLSIKDINYFLQTDGKFFKKELCVKLLPFLQEYKERIIELHLKELETVNDKIRQTALFALY